MIKTVIYARYSAGPRQTDQSIEGQVRECKAYCKKNNMQVMEIYADKHISGKTDERPEFQRLIRDAKAHKFEAVVVWKTDRLSRNKYDAVLYKRELKKAGVQIHYAAETIPEGPEGIILESLMEGLAEYYSAELAQKIKRGMHESATKCKALGAWVPLGYKVSKDKTYEIDPPAADAVKAVFEMYIDKVPNVKICQYLNDRGFRTCQGNLFTKNNINRLIHNEKYIGIYKAADVVIEGGVPAIIDPATWIRAQKVADARKRSQSNREDSADYMISGKLYCGHCGSRMTGACGKSHTGKKYYYYRCSGRSSGCKKKPIDKEFMESMSANIVKDYFAENPGTIDMIASDLYKLQQEGDTRELTIRELTRKLNDVQKKISNILKAIEYGQGTEILFTRLGELNTEKNSIENDIEYERKKTFGLTEDQFKEFIVQFAQTKNEDSDSYKKRMIETFVYRVDAYDDHYSVFYNFPGNSAESSHFAHSEKEEKGSSSDSSSGI